MVDTNKRDGQAARTGESETERQRHLLALHLVCVQRQASAARLEAQAAKIEILLGKWSSDPNGLSDHPACDEVEEHADALTPESQSIDELSAGTRFGLTNQIGGWNAIRSRQGLTEIEPNRCELGIRDRVGARSRKRSSDASSGDRSQNAKPRSGARFAGRVRGLTSRSSSSRGKASVKKAVGKVRLRSRRSRPTPLLISGAVHLGALVMFAFVTLRSQAPMDQLAMTAVVAQANDEPLNTVSLEVADPKLDLNEPAEETVDVDLAAMEPAAMEQIPLIEPTVGSVNSMLRSAEASSTSMQGIVTPADGAPTATTSFCGVEGGGNHFVYLVDSSKSMGRAFDSARRELIRAVDALRPDQRFYVIFFDAESDYMRVSSVDTDDRRSVLATSENKRALRRWAMRIKMDSGKAPYDPLRFALSLRPDVIFLLSDGEFPAGIEDLLRSQNRVQSLFDDDRQRCVVHTIGYHSHEGEERMRRIAQENQGIYRYVPESVSSLDSRSSRAR